MVARPLLAFIASWIGMASAFAATGEACRIAAGRAAERHSIPADVLVAMAEVESGSWPYAIGVNAAPATAVGLARRYAGRGYRASDASTAAAWVRGFLGLGLTSLDVGCLQVNLRWHANAFATLEEAFDAEANADYAARHLKGLKAAHGTWESAVARYHAASRQLQVAYLCRVRARLAAKGWMMADDPRCSRVKTGAGQATAPPSLSGETPRSQAHRRQREERSRSAIVPAPVPAESGP